MAVNPLTDQPAWSSATSGCPGPHNCTGNLVGFSVGRAPTYCSIVSCSLSVLGSLLIFIAYFVLKDIRNTAQKIITLLAIADLFTASGYLLAAWNFLTHFGERDQSKCLNVFQPVCAIQSYITTWSSLCSFGWTCALALHFYLVLSPTKKHLPPKLLVYENIVAWFVPIVIVLPLLCTDKLGFTQYAASNWCFIKDAAIYHSAVEGGSTGDMNWKVIVFMLVAGKLWEILSYLFVVLMYGITRYKFHRQLARQRLRDATSSVSSPQSPYVREVRSEVKQRLLLIPVVFILLRLWGTVQFFYSLATSKKNMDGCISRTSQKVYLALAILQAIGDGGQGWGNALLYIFLSPVIRQELFWWSFVRCIQALGAKVKAIGARMEAAGETSHHVQQGDIEQLTHPPSGSGKQQRPFRRHGSIKSRHTSSRATSTDIDVAHMGPIDHPATSAPLLRHYDEDEVPQTIEEVSVEIKSRDSLSGATARRQHMHQFSNSEYVHV